jgi:hypothetical protein
LTRILQVHEKEKYDQLKEKQKKTKGIQEPATVKSTATTYD